MNSFTQHGVISIRARHFDYENAPLIIELKNRYSDFSNEVVAYLDNDELTAAIVKAINEAVAAHQPVMAEIAA